MPPKLKRNLELDTCMTVTTHTITCGTNQPLQKNPLQGFYLDCKNMISLINRKKPSHFPFRCRLSGTPSAVLQIPPEPLLLQTFFPTIVLSLANTHCHPLTIISWKCNSKRCSLPFWPQGSASQALISLIQSNHTSAHMDKAQLSHTSLCCPHFQGRDTWPQ